MTELYIPQFGRAPEVPTQDAYAAACRAMRRYEDRSNRLFEDLAAIRDLAFRGVGSPADALEAIHARAGAALRREV